MEEDIFVEFPWEYWGDPIKWDEEWLQDNLLQALNRKGLSTCKVSCIFHDVEIRVCGDIVNGEVQLTMIVSAWAKTKKESTKGFKEGGSLK
jgi:hypothetical protein